MAIEQVYLHPEDYELEVASRDVDDLRFWLDLTRRETPHSILEVGCGTGRLTFPLAFEGVRGGFSVTGIDAEARMLERARQHLSTQPARIRDAVTLIEADLRELDLGRQFDMVLMPYGAAHHLLTLSDQLSAWRAARRHLAPNGIFAIDIDAPNMAILHKLSEGTPRHKDLDTTGHDGRRLRRTVASRYMPSAQRALHDYIYHVEGQGGTPRSYNSAFEMHVYYPRELELLCLLTGFTCERVAGSYEGEPFGDSSGQMLMVARRS